MVGRRLPLNQSTVRDKARLGVSGTQQSDTPDQPTARSTTLGQMQNKGEAKEGGRGTTHKQGERGREGSAGNPEPVYGQKDQARNPRREEGQGQGERERRGAAKDKEPNRRESTRARIKGEGREASTQRAEEARKDKEAPKAGSTRK